MTAPTHFRKTITLNGQDAHLTFCKEYTVNWQVHKTSSDWMDVDCFNCRHKSGIDGASINARNSHIAVKKIKEQKKILEKLL